MEHGEKAREIVTAWLEMQREGWTNHHCQHGTTCAEAFNVAGVDEVDRDALVEEITQALADAAAAGPVSARDAKIAALEADLARVREQNQRLQDTLALHTGPRVTMTVSYASELENARDENIRLQSEAREAARRLSAFLKRYDDLMPEVDGLFAFAKVHGIVWPADKNWAAELAELRALAAPDPREPRSQG